jgi:flagellin
VQTAEGALGEVQDMLQRMNELAVKAANGTESESDRTAIQNEIDALTTEIDRVAETTKFNETYLLKGDKDAVKEFSITYNKVEAEQTGSAKFAADPDAAGFKIGEGVQAADGANSDDVNAVLKALRDQGVTVTYSARWNPAADDGNGAAEDSIKLELNGAAADKYNVVVDGDPADGKFKIQTKGGVDVIEGITVTAPTDMANTLDDKNLSFTASSKLSAESVIANKNEDDIAQYYDSEGNKISENALKDYFSVTPTDDDPVKAVKAGAPRVFDAVGNQTTLSTKEIDVKQDLTGALTLNLHVGADATKNNQITLNIETITAKGLGVNGLKVDGADDSNALKAVETVKTALQRVSTQRSALGAVQNRLEHTIKNLDNVVENTTSAEAEIRDTDMATEMVQYSKNNILAQAGQSMLAQANQSNQGVLSLLG